MRTLVSLSASLALLVGTVAYADSITYTQPTTRTDDSPLGDDLQFSMLELFDASGNAIADTMVFDAQLPNTGQEVTQALPPGVLTPGGTYTASMVWVDNFGQQSVPDVFEFSVPLPAAPASGAIKRVTIEFSSGVVQTIEAP